MRPSQSRGLPTVVCRGGATLRLFAVGPLNGSPAAAERSESSENARRRARSPVAARHRRRRGSVRRFRGRESVVVRRPGWGDSRTVQEEVVQEVGGVRCDAGEYDRVASRFERVHGRPRRLVSRVVSGTTGVASVVVLHVIDTARCTRNTLR